MASTTEVPAPALVPAPEPRPARSPPRAAAHRFPRHRRSNPSAHDDDTGTVHGFVAQDVEKVFPSWVKREGYTAPDGQKYKTLELRQIEALEVESIRTLKAENDELKKRVEALESGRRPVVSGMNLNGVGFGVGGLALAGAFIVIGRRKKDEGRT